MDRLLHGVAIRVALLAAAYGVIDTAHGEQIPDQERQIYAEALNALVGNVQSHEHRLTVVVSSDCISMEPGYKMFLPSGMSGERLEEDLRWRLPGAKAETIRNFVRNSTNSHHVSFARELVTRLIDVELASQKDLDAVFGSDHASAWKSFSDRYPGARFLIQFSPIGTNAAGSEAIVYVHRTCEGLCGSGHLILLRRTSKNRWSIRQIHQFWVS